MRTYLANIDWNNLLKNKTATKCWTCLKDDIGGITKRFVPLRKQGKRFKKKHLSKEPVTNIVPKLVQYIHQSFPWYPVGSYVSYETIYSPVLSLVSRGFLCFL